MTNTQQELLNALALAWQNHPKLRLGQLIDLIGNLMLGEGAVLRYAFSPDGFWITLAATVVFGFLASRIPAGGAIGMTTREALAYE